MGEHSTVTEQLTTSIQLCSKQASHYTEMAEGKKTSALSNLSA